MLLFYSILKSVVTYIAFENIILTFPLVFCFRFKPIPKVMYEYDRVGGLGVENDGFGLSIEYFHKVGILFTGLSMSNSERLE